MVRQNTQMKRLGPGRLEGQLRGVLRKVHDSYETERSDVGCYRRYVLWLGKKHPMDLGAKTVSAFLSHLAVDRKVGAGAHSAIRSVR